MASSTWAFCSTALTLVLFGSAFSDDPLVEQREVTFDISQIRQEMQLPDSLMMQRELDLSDLLQDLKTENPDPGFSPRGSRPRSFAPVEKYEVQFPLARPSSENLQAICLNGDLRPRYPESYFPASGFGVYKRRADAVNTLEAWFGTCCKHNQTEVTLCCILQAWRKSINHFCKVDSSIKAPQFHCCKQSGNERFSCFHNAAPNPNYEPTEALPVQPVHPKAKFNFQSSVCQRTSVPPQNMKEGKKGKKGKKPPASVKVDINFPPAAPTEANIESLCRNQKLRPLYNIKCLSGLGYDLVARQAKAINRLEKGLKQCCKKKQNVVSCAHQAWQEEIKKFCIGAKGRKVDYPCCGGDLAEIKFDCFQNISSDPDYNKTVSSDSISLDNVCDSHKVIMKKFPVGFPLKSLVNKCCTQSDTERSSCVPQTLKEMLGAMCSSRKATPPTVRRCCRMSASESPQCFNKILMDAITKATSLSQRKKKRCPIS